MNRSAVLILILLAPHAHGDRGNNHRIPLTDEELKKLDTFESHTLAKADQAFDQGKYRQARAQYDAFILEFPRSKVIHYAVFRKGRCAQLDEKRFKAINDYQEVLDYFPNAVRYASGALYFIGECHWNNGDITKAMKAWAKLADDKDYRTERLAAYALNRLADNLLKRKEEARAVKYYRTVAVNFRTTNREASEHARGPVIRYCIRTRPDEPAFRSFYRDMRGLNRDPRNIPDDLAGDPAYWKTVREHVRRHGQFEALQGELKKTYYGYWAEQMNGIFPDDDDFCIEAARYRFLSHRDVARWQAELEKLFNRGDRNDWQRVVAYVRACEGYPERMKHFSRKINPSTLDNEAIVALMRALWTEEDARPAAAKMVSAIDFDAMDGKLTGSLAYEFWDKDEKVTAAFLGTIDYKKLGPKETGRLAVRFHDRSRSVSRHLVGKIAFADMADEDIAALAGSFWHHNCDTLGRTVCDRIRDAVFRKWTLLRHLHHHRKVKEGLPLATELTKAEQYAPDAWWMRAEFLHWSKKWSAAVAAYKNCEQKAPANKWRIAECYEKLGKVASAIRELKEIEQFFKKHAARAAWRIAEVYRRAKREKEQVAALRKVLKKYPESQESSKAHQVLEQMGIRIGGGTDAK